MSKVKRQLINCKNIFVTCDKVDFLIYKEFLQINKGKTNNIIYMEFDTVHRKKKLEVSFFFFN